MKRPARKSRPLFFGEKQGALEKSQCAYLNALAWRRVRRAVRIVKSGVGRPACPAIPARIESFENDRFVALHIWEVVPAMIRIEGAMINLADSVGIYARAGKQLFRADCSGVGDGEGLSMHWMANGSPYL